MNYFLVGWLNGNLDKYYVESWQSKSINLRDLINTNKY